MFIDESSLSPETKLLYLRQHVSGEASNLLNGIGYNADAYEIAKNRLGRRYGGERRKIGLFLEKIENFETIKPGNAFDLERFSNFLDLLVVNLKESNLENELNSGLLYVQLQKKMNKSLVASFHRWLHEQNLNGSVMTLRKFISLESEFEIIAEETDRGFSNSEVDTNFFVSENSELEQQDYLKCIEGDRGMLCSDSEIKVDKNIFLSCSAKQNKSLFCYICKKNHEIVECPKFISSTVEERQKLVMKYGLCFGCIGRGHIKKNCNHGIVCQKCQKNHNTLFPKKNSILPNKLQLLAELSYTFVSKMIGDTAGSKARPYFAFIFSLFMFVLFCNMFGMIPYTFTVTSHIIVTFMLAAFIFIGVTIIGFIKHGFGYLKLFVPSGVPAVLLPLIVVIEIISYLSRPISLSVRLFANMMAGHTMMKVFGGFVISLGIVGGWLPLSFSVALTGLEILVAFLQAYVFAILTCIYLNDALNLHH